MRLGLHLADPLPDMLGHYVAHLHWPEERQQASADLPRVVRPNARLQQVIRQPFLQDVCLEALPAATGVTLLSGPHGGLGQVQPSVASFLVLKVPADRS